MCIWSFRDNIKMLSVKSTDYEWSTRMGPCPRWGWLLPGGAHKVTAHLKMVRGKDTEKQMTYLSPGISLAGPAGSFSESGQTSSCQVFSGKALDNLTLVTVLPSLIASVKAALLDGLWWIRFLFLTLLSLTVTKLLTCTFFYTFQLEEYSFLPIDFGPGHVTCFDQ